RRQARGLAQDRERPVRRGGARRGQDPGEPEISAEGRAEGAPRSRKPPYNGIEHSAAVIGGMPIVARSADQPGNAREGPTSVRPWRKAWNSHRVDRIRKSLDGRHRLLERRRAAFAFADDDRRDIEIAPRHDFER